MKQLRRGVFETNSSSTHSICISKEKPTHIPSEIWFRFGEYGWERGVADSEADYLYTAMHEMGMEDEIERLGNILEKHGITCHFARSRREWGDGYVDHCEDLRELIDALLADEDLLFRYLFSSDTTIYTGNDNVWDYDKSYSACPTVWDDKTGASIPNPDHEPERYDYFFKGN